MLLSAAWSLAVTSTVAEPKPSVKVQAKLLAVMSATYAASPEQLSTVVGDAEPTSVTV